VRIGPTACDALARNVKSLAPREDAMAMKHQMIQTSWARIKPAPRGEVQELL